MNVSRLKRMIADGWFATVMFVKRSTGETRRMRCRTGVTKALRGGAPAYDPDEHGLVTVYDLDRRDYRSIPVDSVVEVRAAVSSPAHARLRDGMLYRYEGEQQR